MAEEIPAAPAPIVQAAIQPEAPDAGVPEGTEIHDGETVVYDRDENGAVLGWHKVPGPAGPHPISSPDGADQPIVPDPQGA